MVTMDFNVPSTAHGHLGANEHGEREGEGGGSEKGEERLGESEGGREKGEREGRPKFGSLHLPLWCWGPETVKDR